MIIGIRSIVLLVEVDESVMVSEEWVLLLGMRSIEEVICFRRSY